ncbi:MAG: hypothetical protein H0U95_03240 [Bacteroidetes bacterium]|nr:hypothetical protein [Bacteroidota bacterium]
MKIKILLFVFFCVFSPKNIFSQNHPAGFKIIANGTVLPNEIPKYINAISAANMENYRFKSTQDTLEFTNGLKFVLLSAHELFVLEKKIDPTHYSEKIKGYLMPKFQLATGGTLIALYPNNPNIKNKN